MRRFAAAVLGALLLAGCSAAPAASMAQATPETAVSAAPAAGTAQEQCAVLDQFVSYGADTAGGSLKTTQAAAALVAYLSVSDLEADVMTVWLAGLDADQQETLALNWPGILSEAQAIAADPAAESGALDSAGVTIDFSDMELDGVPDKLDAVNDALTGEPG